MLMDYIAWRHGHFRSSRTGKYSQAFTSLWRSRVAYPRCKGSGADGDLTARPVYDA